MLTDNASHVLIQVGDQFRNSSLRSDEARLLAFQLLVWCHLSAKNKVRSDDRVDTVLPFGVSGIVEALNRLAMHDGALGQAFSDASRSANFAGDFVVSALLSARRLEEGGIFERFSPAEISGDLLQSSLGYLSVPMELAKLMAHLTLDSNVRSAYCPWESSGQFIGALLREKVRLYAETPNPSPLPALLSLFRDAPTTLMLADPLRSPTAMKGGHLEKFDAALAFPPMGMHLNEDIASQDLYSRFPISRATSSGLMTQHVIAQTAGRAAIVVPNSFLFGPGKDREVREFLLSRGWVESVIALPSGIHHASNMLTAILVVNTHASNRTVAFVDASQPYFRKTQAKGRVTLDNIEQIASFCKAAQESPQSAVELLESSLAVMMPVHEILEKDASLQVDRYVMADELRELQARLESIPTVSLDSIAELQNPLPNKDRNSEDPSAIEVYEVGAVDLPAAGYIATPAKTVSVTLANRRGGNSDDVFLRAGDLVLITKGSAGKIGIVPRDVPPAGPGGWIAGQSAIVLRGARTDIDLRGVGLWLRGEMGKNVLASIVSGATIPMISIQTLRKLQLPILTVKSTDRAIQVLDLEARIQQQIETLLSEQASVADQLWSDLLR